MFCPNCGAATVEEATPKAAKKRTFEFVLGLLGGILGILSGTIAFSFSELFAAFSNYEVIAFNMLGLYAVLFSIIGIMGAILVNRHGKLSGLLMLTAAIGGLISITWTFLIPFILLLIPGIMGLVKANQNARKERWSIWMPLAFILLFGVFILKFGPDYIEEQRLKNEVNLMMEEVKVGDLTYNIDSFYYKDEVNGYRPNGTFIIFNMTLRNDGLESEIFDTGIVQLIGSDGAIYNANPDVSYSLNKQNQFNMNLVNPNISVKGRMAFDVPDQERTFEIRVTGGFTSTDIKLIKMAKRSVTSQ